MTFIGATHGQLVVRMGEAFEQRGRQPWHHVELFFLDDKGLESLATAGRSFELLRDEREKAKRALGEALRTFATTWKMYAFSEPFQFASLWRRKLDDGSFERRVHASAVIWGGDIRHAPATDYIEFGGDTVPEVVAYFEGAEALRGRPGTKELA